MRLVVNFDVASDPNTDQVLTQMRQSQAESQLPTDVRNYGITGCEIDVGAADGCHPYFTRRKL